MQAKACSPPSTLHYSPVLQYFYTLPVTLPTKTNKQTSSLLVFEYIIRPLEVKTVRKGKPLWADLTNLHQY